MQRKISDAMRKILVFIIAVFVLTGCNADDTSKASIMEDVKPPLRYNPRHGTNSINNTDEKIRLLKAQTDAKVRLVEVEMKKQERLRKLETQRDATIAKFEAQKAKTLKQIELEQTKNTNTANTNIAASKAQTSVVIEKERQKHMLVKQKENLLFYRQLTIAVIVLAILLMLLLYMLYRHRQFLKLKLHEEELRHQAYLQESRHYHEKVTKMLEIIADDSTDKGLKKELTKLLKSAGEKPTALLQVEDSR
jgi:hypothetical protein